MAYEILFAIHFGGGLPAFFVDADNITPYVKNASWSIGMSQPYQLVADDIRATITVNNSDGRFSPEDASGAYYGDLVPGIFFEIYAKQGTSYTTIWLGYVESVKPVPGVYNSNEAMITCIGVDKVLKNTEVNLPLMQNVTADEIIAAILDQVPLPGISNLGWLLGVAGTSELGVSTYLRSVPFFTWLQSGAQVFPYVGDNWEPRTHAAREIADAVSGERGRFFIDRTGRAVFWNREYLQKRTTLADTFDESDWRDLDYSHSDDIVNEVTVVVHPRSITSSEVILWELDETLEIPKEGEKTIRARYTEQDSDAKVSALYTVFPTIAAGTLEYYYKDGSGTFVAATDSTQHLSINMEADARGAKLTLISSHTDDIEVRSLQLLGPKITTYNEVEVTEVDGESQTLYGTRSMRIDLKLLDSDDDGRNIARYELVRRSQPRGLVKSVRLSNKPANDDKKIDLGMASRIAIQDAKTQHDDEYFIIGEKHVYTREGQHEVTWIVELASSSRAWLLGVTGYSELGINTYLGF